MVKPKRGAPKGHPGWGGRPKGETLARCIKCHAELTAAELRNHFRECTGAPVGPSIPEFIAALNAWKRFASECEQRRVVIPLWAALLNDTAVEMTDSILAKCTRR